MTPNDYAGTVVRALALGHDSLPDDDWTLDATDAPDRIDLVGVLVVNYVDDLHYTQYVVNGIPVDPATVAPTAVGVMEFTYDPNQPRHPAGSSEGGRFAPKDGVGTGQDESWRVDPADNLTDAIRGHQVMHDGEWTSETWARRFYGTVAAADQIPDDEAEAALALLNNSHEHIHVVLDGFAARDASKIIDDIEAASVGFVMQVAAAQDLLGQSRQDPTDLRNVIERMNGGEIPESEAAAFIAERYGITPLVAAVSVTGMEWSFRSDSTWSTAMQLTVAERFGLTESADRMYDYRGGLDIQELVAGEFAPVLNAVTTGIHAHTQNVIAAAGVTQLDAHRGMVETPFRASPGEVVDVTMNPLSSWTYDQMTAATFATGPDGAVVSIQHDRPEDVFAIAAFTGMGQPWEQEVVMLGRTKPATIMMMEDPEDLYFAVTAAGPPPRGDGEQYDGTVDDVDAELDLTDAHRRVADAVARYRSGEFRYDPNQPRHPAGSTEGGRFAPKLGPPVSDYDGYGTIDGDGGRFEITPGYGGSVAQAIMEWEHDDLANLPSGRIDSEHRPRIEATLYTDDDGNVTEVVATWLSDEGVTEHAMEADNAARQALIDHFGALGVDVRPPAFRERMPEVGEEGWEPRTAAGAVFHDMTFRTPDGETYQSIVDTEDGDEYESSVSGRILDDGGGSVGTYERGFDGYTVSNRSLTIYSTHRGKGVGTAFLDASESEFAQLGAEQVTLQAVDVGRYAWAARGYALDPNRNSSYVTEDWITEARSYMDPSVDSVQIEQINALGESWRSADEIYPIDLVAIEPVLKNVLLSGPSWYGYKNIFTRERPEDFGVDPFDEFSFDPNQPRDEHGRWTIGVATVKGQRIEVDTADEFGKLSPAVRESSPSSWFADTDEFAAAVALADEKARNVPQPSEEQIAKNLAAEQRARESGGRPGGWGRGNSYTRRERGEALFREFGGHEKGYCPCTGCGIKLSPGGRDGYAAMQQDKILTTREGGTYGTAKSGFQNLIPACGGCNNSRGATPHPVRPAWESDPTLFDAVAAAAGPAPDDSIVTAFPMGWDRPDEYDTIGTPVRGRMTARTVTAWFGTYEQTVVGGEVVDPATVIRDDPTTEFRFDPSQPRDENGRWTDTGGGGGDPWADPRTPVDGEHNWVEFDDRDRMFNAARNFVIMAAADTPNLGTTGAERIRTMRELRRHQDQQMEDPERTAVLAYTNDAHDYVNTYLRRSGGGEVDDYRLVDNLDSAFAHARPAPPIVMRGLDEGGGFPVLDVGDEFVDHAYMSTTVDAPTALAFAGLGERSADAPWHSAVLRIRTNGTPGIVGHPGEMETILPRSTPMRVTGITEFTADDDDGQEYGFKVYDLEVMT